VAYFPSTYSSMRIAMLANNPCVTDARIRREAEALAAMGHTVVIFAHWKQGLAASEHVNGVEYQRLPMRFVDRRNYRLSKRPNSAVKPAPARAEQLPGGPAIKRTFLQKLQRASVAKVRGLLFNHLSKKLNSVANTMRVQLGSRTAINSLTPSGDSLVRHARHYTKPVSRWKPDVVHAHDLYTLLAGARIARQAGARLVYDSHELELGRSGNFSERELLVRARAEQSLITLADGVITVCDSIEDFLADHYKIRRPEVIHNAPALTIPAERDGAPADHVRRRIGLSDDTPLAIYVGSVTFNRGVEQSVRALPHLPGVHLATVGPRNAKIEAEIQRIAEELGVHDRLHLIDPVPHDQVTSFVRTADVSLVTVQNVCLSYKFCFPNKLLESLLSGVPVVVARLDELQRMVSLTGGGVIVDETDPAAIAAGISEIVKNRQRYVLSPERVASLQKTYGWERQVEKLGAFYSRLQTGERGAARKAG